MTSSSVRPARVLIESHPTFADHDAGWGHPEAPGRLAAALDGVDGLDLGNEVVRVEPRPATTEELARVHEASNLVQANGREGILACSFGGSACFTTDNTIVRNIVEKKGAGKVVGDGIQYRRC